MFSPATSGWFRSIDKPSLLVALNTMPTKSRAIGRCVHIKPTSVILPSKWSIVPYSVQLYHGPSESRTNKYYSRHRVCVSKLGEAKSKHIESLLSLGKLIQPYDLPLHPPTRAIRAGIEIAYRWLQRHQVTDRKFPPSYRSEPSTQQRISEAPV